MKSIKFVFPMDNIEINGDANFDDILTKLREAEEANAHVVSFTHRPKNSFFGVKEFHINMRSLLYWVFEDGEDRF